MAYWDGQILNSFVSEMVTIGGSDFSKYPLRVCFPTTHKEPAGRFRN